MAIRYTGKDATVLTVGSLNPLAVYQRVSVEETADTIDTSSVKDEWATFAIRRKSWRITLSALAESNPFEFLQALKNASELNPLLVVCTVTDPNNPNTTHSFSGNAIPSSTATSLEDILNRDLTLTGIGEPTIT